MGTSLLLVRLPEILDIIQNGIDKLEITASKISVEKVIQSQSRVLAFKRKQISYRSYLAQQKRLKMPEKRVNPSKNIELLKKRETKLKAIMQEKSKQFFLDYCQNQPVSVKNFRSMIHPCIKQARQLRLLGKFTFSMLSIKKNKQIRGKERMSGNPTFIMAGNGPYDNRGCEAIVRGTAKILRHYYKDPSFLCVSFFQNQEQFEKQSREEFDSAIVHKKTNTNLNRFSPEWALQRTLRKIAPIKYTKSVYKELYLKIKDSKAVLSIGGDNYSLDYGIPKLFTGLDDLVLKKNKPIIIWGASVGPFDRLPEYEKYMKKHLQNIKGIFARESATIEYLEKIGITENVHKAADPAFLMDPTKPQYGKELEIEEDSIGINLSPLMAKYVSNGDMNSWINTASEIVEEIAKRKDNKIYLIPHVTFPHSNDYPFLKEVKARIKDTEKKITLIPPIYNASETKWIISQMELFAGARTHSTIAALSSHVPTLSFAYSLKAKGINKDIFGHEDFCLNPEKLNAGIVTEKIELMLENKRKIRLDLEASIPKIEKEALLVGKTLQEITG
jgi:polysaccharide pyruvyl transferase WcaK-like protein